MFIHPQKQMTLDYTCIYSLVCSCVNMNQFAQIYIRCLFLSLQEFSGAIKCGPKCKYHPLIASFWQHYINGWFIRLCLNDVLTIKE